MKNMALLPPDMRPLVEQFQWNCGCGKTGLRISVTRKGTLQGRCYECGNTLYWNDLGKFASGQPFCPHPVDWHTLRKPGTGWTSWCPRCRIRRFQPAQTQGGQP